MEEKKIISIVDENGAIDEAEELLRLKQLSGLQELFKDKQFSKSWIEN